MSEEVQRGVDALVAAAGMALAGDGALRIQRHITAMPSLVHGAPLVEVGAFTLARHPIYGGLVMAGAGLAIVRNSALGELAAAALFGYFHLKSGSKEGRLAAVYPGYMECRR